MDSEALIRRSAELAERGEWSDEALALNRELAERHPDPAGARYRLALCLEEAGEALAARDAYARFLARRPTGLEARIARRRLAVLEERARAAAARSPYAALGKARQLAGRGEIERAHVWYDRADELASTPGERAKALTGRAALLRTERKLGEALAVAERATRARPSRARNRAAYVVLTAILADLGRLDSAREEAEALLADSPRNRVVNATAGRVFADLYRKTGDRSFLRRSRSCFRQTRRGR